MIPKECPLNDKAKLQATLKSECLLGEVSDNLYFCKECPYSAKKKEWKIYEKKFDELLEDWVKFSGIKVEKDDTEDLPPER